jgi:hypothetical protein
MATLSQLHNVQSGSLKKPGQAQLVQQLAQNIQPVPLPPVNQGVNQPDQQQADPNSGEDLLSQLTAALSGFSSGGGRGGFRGSSGSSQAQTNLSLQQQTDLLNAEAQNQKANFGLLAESLQNKSSFANQSYQNQLQSLAQQYGSSLFGLNTSAAGSGAYGSMGANRGRTDLASSNALQQTALGQQNAYTQGQIVEAQKKAYANALLSNTKLGQGMDMNALQRQEAGMPAQGWWWQ